MNNFAGWTAATHCVGGPRPGAVALMKYAVGRWERSRNWGIYSCRNVVGGSSYSCHAEGRACDIGVPYRGHVGDLIAAAFADHGRRLGIQAIIWDRRIYSAKSPGGRYYTGTNPHYDHVHIELTRAAAGSLTYTTVRNVMGGGSGGSTAHPSQLPYNKKPSSHDGVIYLSKVGKVGQANADVAEVQRCLNAWYRAGLKVDGHWGAKTEQAWKNFQKKMGHEPNGIPGRYGLEKLGFKVRN